MPRSLIGITFAVALVTAFPAVQAQRVSDARVAAIPDSARVLFEPAMAANENLTPRWPFVLTGTLIGGVLGARSYARAVRRAEGWGNPVVGAVFIGGSAIVGGLCGFVVGQIVREARRLRPAV